MENDGTDSPGVSRREFLERVAAGGAGLAVAGCLARPGAPAWAAKGSVTLADVGVGDPGGDWSKFSGPTGWDVKLVAMGNAPSGVLNVLIAGGGTQIYDVVNIVGGMQKPLVENNLIEPIDTARMPNWGKDTYIREFLAPGKPGFDFIGYKGNVYGVPTVLQGDSFAYLPEKTGPLDSYGALFDPKWKGFVALEDNFTTTGQKTALYLQKNKLASIKDPAKMTPAEIKTVIDFLLGGWYGAKITLSRGYMTNPAAVAYAKSNPGEFGPAEAQEIAAIDANVRKKFQFGGTWQNRWPTHVETYESEWARFKAA